MKRIRNGMPSVKSFPSKCRVEPTTSKCLKCFGYHTEEINGTNFTQNCSCKKSSKDVDTGSVNFSAFILLLTLDFTPRIA